MKILAVVGVVVLTAASAFAGITDPSCKGVLYGIAATEDKQPVPNIEVTLWPLGVTLGYVLPTARTSESGAYRFEHVCAGRFTVIAEDERAGYPNGIWTLVMTRPPEVKLTLEHLQAELAVTVPPKGWRLDVVAQNRRTGTTIPRVTVMLKLRQNPKQDWMNFYYYADWLGKHPLLLPPNIDLLCRVTSEGFREWQEGRKRGKPIRMSPEAHMTLAVRLEPLHEGSHGE